MEMKSLYGDLAIDLLCGQVERNQPHTHAIYYGRDSARPERNDHFLNGSPSTMHSGGYPYIQKPFAQSSEGSRKTERIPKQNTLQKTCTELAAEIHFASISKDVFQCRPPTKSGCFPASILASPEQESGDKNDNSVHGHFFKMPSRQDDQFFYRTGSVGKCTSSDFWVFIRLLLTQLIISSTITQFDYSVQG